MRRISLIGKRTLRGETRPVSSKLTAVRVCPFRYERQNTRRKLTIDDVCVRYPNLCAMAFRTQVQVMWAAIVEVRRDHDAKEPADQSSASYVTRRRSGLDRIGLGACGAVIPAAQNEAFVGMWRSFCAHDVVARVHLNQDGFTDLVGAVGFRAVQ